MKKIAIVGFGFCGKTAFVKLIDKLDLSDELLIFDAAPTGFSSVAFADFSRSYILNVPANKMSAFCDDERDFCRYLEKNNIHIDENGYAPRYIYGNYIAEILDAALLKAKNKGIKFQIIKDEVIAVKKTQNDDFLVATASDNFVGVNDVILASSFCQTELPFKIEAENFIEKLWSEKALNFHKNSDFSTICLVGTGLTAVDVIVGLKSRNFAGKIYAISRRGNFPKKHFNADNPNFIEVDDAKKGVLFLCLKIRNFLRLNQQFDLRQVVDGVRSITTDLWHNFDEKNKKLFLRFLMPYWNIFRHRAPEASIEIIEQMINSGQLEVKRGSIAALEKSADKLLAITNKGEQLKVDSIVNCLGFEFNAKKYPLLLQMLEDGLLEKDLLMIVSKNSKIHLVGGLNIGKDFECTAVPDLRVNVQRVVSSISSATPAISTPSVIPTPPVIPA